MENGKLIVIEGSSDGIGKTTQKELLQKELIDSSYDVYTHHFPSYNEPQGKLVEMYLNGDFGPKEELSPYFITFLFAMDRSVTWIDKLKKEYDSGKIVLLDRYTTSSLIYQSAMIDDEDKKKDFIDYVINFEYNVLKTKEPDIVIFLKAPYEVADAFREMRNKTLQLKEDIHEKDSEYMKKVNQNANFVAQYLGWTIIDYIDKDSERVKTIDEINQEIIDALNKKLNINIKRVLK